jgi:hypothetical protein
MSDVRAAARRVIRDVPLYLGTRNQVLKQGITEDILTVARYALEAADRQAALAAEMERLRAALARAHNEGTHATRCAGRIGGVLREIDPDRCDCWRSSVRAVLAPDTAPAVAPGGTSDV